MMDKGAVLLEQLKQVNGYSSLAVNLMMAWFAFEIPVNGTAAWAMIESPSQASAIVPWFVFALNWFAVYLCMWTLPEYYIDQHTKATKLLDAIAAETNAAIEFLEPAFPHKTAILVARILGMSMIGINAAWLLGIFWGAFPVS